jgi:hypothetical protein
MKQMPVDAEAAGKTSKEKKDNPLDIGNITETPGQRMKELVNLDTFRNSISNICQLWLGGIPAPPRRYEQWKSKIVQQEKISFAESTPTTVSSTGTTTTATASAAQTSGTTQSNSNPSLLNGVKNAGAESISSSSHRVTFKRNKRKEPHELLEEMYKHTCDPLPE